MPGMMRETLQGRILLLRSCFVRLYLGPIGHRLMVPALGADLLRISWWGHVCCPKPLLILPGESPPLDRSQHLWHSLLRGPVAPGCRGSGLEVSLLHMTLRPSRAGLSRDSSGLWKCPSAHLQLDNPRTPLVIRGLASGPLPCGRHTSQAGSRTGRLYVPGWWQLSLRVWKPKSLTLILHVPQLSPSGQPMS